MLLFEERILYKALGFLAVALKDEGDQKDSSERAKKLAQMMESFCALPESQREPDPQGKIAPLKQDEIDDVIDRLKNSAHIRQLISVTNNQSLLTHLYHRLQERQREQASPAFIREEIARLIEMEL